METQLSEYDIKLNEEHDRIQAKYKFPISLINLYAMREGSSENTLHIYDGVSSLTLCFNGFEINESETFWDIRKGSTSVTLSKDTRRISTYIL